MDRLTARHGRYITVKGCKAIHYCIERKDAPASNAVVRLAAYEDTGLTPEEIIGLCSMDRRARMAEILRKEESRPLTLDELREMDRELVWVDFPKCPEASRWMLISTGRHCVYDGLLGYCDFDNYGKTWLAYRRRLEETHP